MIIFDLDGTLALCEHRRHFVDPTKKHPNGMFMAQQCYHDEDIYFKRDPITFECTNNLWHPNWDAFYEACDKDLPNVPIIKIFKQLYCSSSSGDVVVWSGRSMSVYEKTTKWLWDHAEADLHNFELKMRPIGDSTPDDQLKEKWLDEAIAAGKTVELVFDDRQKVVDMWRRRGIVCCQVAEGAF